MHEFRDARLPERFWSKVSVSRAGCWVWLAALKPDGYGQFWSMGKMRGVHRFAYEALVAEIPSGLVTDHLCRVRNCVNPAHMEIVTNHENILRGDGPAGKCARKTHCSRGHEYTEENTMRTFPPLRPNGFRICRKCHNARNREYRRGGHSAV